MDRSRRDGGSTVDVAIVGARVAGSITAALLGDAGYSVLLLDSASFPSDTISTHFFRGGGLGGMLERLGLLELVLALGCPPLTREYEFGLDPMPVVVDPQEPGALGYNLSCRRLPLDALLLERARASGVEVRERSVARSLVVDEAGRVAGLVVDHDGRHETVRADLVVGADGRGSPVARWLDAPVDRREPAARALYFRYLTGFRGPDGSWDGPGLGMDNAGVHAGFLAQAIDDWRSGRTSEDEAFRTYRARRDEHALPGFNFTAEYGRDLSRLRSG